MDGNDDIAKGRIKEAAGALVGNDKLRDKGKNDQAVGKTKHAADKIINKIEKRIR